MEVEREPAGIFPLTSLLGETQFYGVALTDTLPSFIMGELSRRVGAKVDYLKAYSRAYSRGSLAISAVVWASPMIIRGVPRNFYVDCAPWYLKWWGFNCRGSLRCF